MARNNKNESGLSNLQKQVKAEQTQEENKVADVKPETKVEAPKEATTESKETKAKSKGKAGRKVTKDVKNTCTNINVAIPNELYDKWKEIKTARGNNLTQYVTDLIQKDMDENYDKYKQIISMLNDL
jgi:hypothetical protein